MKIYEMRIFTSLWSLEHVATVTTHMVLYIPFPVFVILTTAVIMLFCL